MIANELPSGGYEQLLVAIHQCLRENSGAVADLGDGRFFLAGELPAWEQYGAWPEDDDNPLSHLVVAVGAASLNDGYQYRLALLCCDTDSDEEDGAYKSYMSYEEEIFHTNPGPDDLERFDEVNDDDWRARLENAKFSSAASWFHISSDDPSKVVQAAIWGDEEAQRKLDGHQAVEEWRQTQQRRRPLNYDY